MDNGSARERMVDRQIVSRGVSDPRVLAAMREVPRDLFVPATERSAAYEDRPIPIGQGQTISQPYMVAAMTAALELRDTDRVLEIGTGSGYQTAVLARLARIVFSIERHETLALGAVARLEEAGVRNVRIRVGDGTEGWPGEAPFDRILVTAGSPQVPEPLRSQLADGGRMVIPVGPAGYQRLTILTRTGDVFETLERDGCVFVPLIGRHGWSADA